MKDAAVMLDQLTELTRRRDLPENARGARLDEAVRILGPRLRVAGDVALHRYLFTDFYDVPPFSLVDREHLCLFGDYMATLCPGWSADELRHAADRFVLETNTPLRDICGLVRAALTGERSGADVFRLMAYLGKTTTQRRISLAVVTPV